MFGVNWIQNIIEDFTGKWCWMTYISLLSAMFFSAMALTQYLNCRKTLNTTSLKKTYTILLPITNTFLFIYDVLLFVLQYLNGVIAFGILIMLLFNGLTSCYLTMAMKIKHSKAAKKLGISDIEYYEKYLKPIALKKQQDKEKKHK